MTMASLEKHFLFSLNILTFFVYGTSLSAFGISLQEYQRNIHMNIRELSFGVSLSAVFGCVSCLMAAWTLDFKRFNRQLQFSLFLVIYGLVTIIYPLCTSYTVYIANSILAGGIIAYINSIPSIWVVELFQENAHRYVQILHFVFPIGELAGPIIVSPFLRDDKNFTFELTPEELEAAANQTAQEGFFERLFEVTKTSNLWIPYMFISGLKILIGILVFAAYVVKPYRKSESKEMIKSPDEEYDMYQRGKRDLSRKYYLLFATLVCLIVGINWCNEQNHYNYISTYLQNTKNLTEKTASYGQGLLSIAITVGRLLNIFITMRVKVQHMLFVNFVVMVIGNVVLIINDYSGLNSMEGAYTGIILIGLGFSSLHPFLISFVEERISMSNRLIAFMTLASNTFTTFASLLIGDLLDFHAERFIVLNLIITSSAFVLYVVLSTLESIRLKKIMRTFGITKINEKY